MDVAVTELRAQLSRCLDRVRRGEEIVVTEHGVPVARISAVTTTATLERLRVAGVIGRSPHTTRPTAAGRARPRPQHSVAEHVSSARR